MSPVPEFLDLRLVWSPFLLWAARPPRGSVHRELPGRRDLKERPTHHFFLVLVRHEEDLIGMNGQIQVVSSKDASFVAEQPKNGIFVHLARCVVIEGRQRVVQQINIGVRINCPRKRETGLLTP